MSVPAAWAQGIADGELVDGLWACFEFLAVFAFAMLSLAAVGGRRPPSRRAWLAALALGAVWVLTVAHPGGPFVVKEQFDPTTMGKTPVASTDTSRIRPFSWHGMTARLYRVPSGCWDGCGDNTLKLSVSRFGLWRTAADVCDGMDGPCIDDPHTRVSVDRDERGDLLVTVVGSAYLGTFRVRYHPLAGSVTAWWEWGALALLLGGTALIRRRVVRRCAAHHSNMR